MQLFTLKVRRPSQRFISSIAAHRHISTCWSAHCHLHFHHVDGVPAALDLLRPIAGLFDENDSGEAVVQVPQVHGRHATFKVALQTNQSKGGLLRVQHQCEQLPPDVLTGLCTGQRHYWLQPRVSSGELKASHHLRLEDHTYYSMGT